MSQAPDRRYNDRDIEDDPYLVTWAEAYATQYTGDYAPMIVPGVSPWGWMDTVGPTLRHLHAVQAYGQCGTLLKAPHFLTRDERHRDYAGRPLCSRCRALS